MPNPSKDSDEIIDTLSLSEELWNELSAKLDKIEPGQTGQRIHRRVSYRKLAQVAVAIQQPNGKWAKYVVRSRDLSTGGFGFIHGTYVHTNSKCRLIIKNLDGKVVCLEGAVRHCEYLLGTAHDVGVQFDVPIDLTDFTDIAPEDLLDAAGTSEATDPHATAEASGDAEAPRASEQPELPGNKRAAG